MLELKEVLALFTLLFGIMVVPGMDMALVAGTALRHGSASAAWALAGIVTGGVILSIWTAAITVFILFNGALLLFSALALGSLYLGWLGLVSIRDGVRSAPGMLLAKSAGASTQTDTKSFCMGVATCVANPKAHMFLLSVLPPLFARHAASVPSIAAEYAVLAALIQVSVYGAVIAAVRHSVGWLSGRPEITRWISIGAGLILIGMAIAGAGQAAFVMRSHGLLSKA